MHKTLFYSDRKVVLGYIHNRTRRFYTYVAHRVQQILTCTAAEQWSYVQTNLNPQINWRYQIGSLVMNFYASSSTSLIRQSISITFSSRPEITVFATKSIDNTLRSGWFSRFSSWTSTVRAITKLIHFATIHAKTVPGSTIKLVERSKGLVLRKFLLEFFSEDDAALQNSSGVRKTKILVKLDPFLLKIGSRLNSSKFNWWEKHPMVIHRSSHVATLLVRH